jgi:hypothetical protein
MGYYMEKATNKIPPLRSTCSYAGMIEKLSFILHHVHHLDQKPGVLVFNLCICHTGDSAKLSVCYRCSSLAF